MAERPQDRLDLSQSALITEQRRLEAKIKEEASKLLQKSPPTFGFQALKQGLIDMLLREENGGNSISPEQLKDLTIEAIREHRAPKGIKRPFHER
jgi:hypothetical protein